MKKIILLLYLISAIFYYLLLKEVIYKFDLFYDYVFILLIILYLLYGYSLIIDNVRLQFITYFISLLIVLFYRKSEVGFNFDFYLLDWLPYLFKNKIVFLNVIGNILIFIPFGLYTKKIYIGLLFIILMEFLQVTFHRGMFDIVDIFLNLLGFTIGSIEVTLWQKMIKIKKT
ncbi:MAG TPA: VanZ family protein [Bacilli bacterium]